MPVADDVIRYAVRLVRMTRPGETAALDFVKNWVEYGASVRAAQYLILGGKARALMLGHAHVGFDDIRALAKPVLRHRLLRTFAAESARVTTDTIVDRILERGRLLRLDGPSVRTKHLPADVLSDEGQQDSIVARVSGKPGAEFPERTGLIYSYARRNSDS